MVKTFKNVSFKNTYDTLMQAINKIHQNDEVLAKLDPMFKELYQYRMSGLMMAVSKIQAQTKAIFLELSQHKSLLDFMGPEVIFQDYKLKNQEIWQNLWELNLFDLDYLLGHVKKWQTKEVLQEINEVKNKIDQKQKDIKEKADEHLKEFNKEMEERHNLVIQNDLHHRLTLEKHRQIAIQVAQQEFQERFGKDKEIKNLKDENAEQKKELNQYQVRFKKMCDFKHNEFKHNKGNFCFLFKISIPLQKG